MSGSTVEPLELARRVASGLFDATVLDILSRGFTAFLNAEGDVPLERCLRIPKSKTRFRLAQRNYWLSEVAKTMEEVSSSEWGLAIAVSKEISTFIDRGAWRHWRQLNDPPAGTSNLRVALFYTAKLNEGKPLSAKQVSRVVGHVFHLSMSMDQEHALHHADVAEHH
jgi:hypothetical protein